jgi:anti-anti-sigma factor
MMDAVEITSGAGGTVVAMTKSRGDRDDLGHVMSATVDRRDGLAVVRTDGYINNEAAVDVQRHCDQLLDEGFKRILVNLKDTKIVNSIGISILVEIIERATEHGARIGFCELTPVIGKTFEIMGIASHATVYPTEDHAVEQMRA